MLWVKSSVSRVIQGPPEKISLRNPGIEFMRALAAISVILIHTNPFRNHFSPTLQMFGDFINVTARLAVPFFLVASGYFFQKNTAKGWRAQVIGFCQRLFFVYIVWFLLYTLFDLYWIKNALFSWKRFYAFLGFFSSPSGTSTRHLWFFPALIQAMFLSVLIRQFFRPKSIVPLMIALFAVGNLYPEFRGFFPRAIRPLLWAPFFLLGTWMAERKWNASPYYLPLGLCATLLQFPDFMLRKYFWNVSVDTFYLLTPLAVLCLFIFALNFHTRFSRACTMLGSYSLGVYAIHCVFLYIVGAIHRFATPGMYHDVLRPLTIMVASFVSVMIIKRIPGLRRIC